LLKLTQNYYATGVFVIYSVYPSVTIGVEIEQIKLAMVNGQFPLGELVGQLVANQQSWPTRCQILGYQLVLQVVRLMEIGHNRSTVQTKKAEKTIIEIHTTVRQTNQR